MELQARPAGIVSTGNAILGPSACATSSREEGAKAPAAMAPAQGSEDSTVTTSRNHTVSSTCPFSLSMSM
jgi:hypothetical protein